MKAPEVDCEEVGVLLIDLKAGEGSFYLDTDAHAWNAIGRIGQLDILSDWIERLQKAQNTACDNPQSRLWIVNFNVDQVEHDL
tara:strand:- start:132 stop:380 length:249 start_codon:yes stop_codon:yes gene_type:complete